jgi:FdhE protein
MAQRVLEPGEIAGLAQRSIPRIRLPVPAAVFAVRAARLRSLAPKSGIGTYLLFLAAVVDAQHSALTQLKIESATDAHLKRAAEHGMPPIPPAGWHTHPQWFETLNQLCLALGTRADLPMPVVEILARLRRAPSRWLAGQIEKLLENVAEGVEAAAAPLLMAALQVHGVARAARFDAAAVRPLDVSGLCPLCGTLPVVSRVCANAPYQGYRYLHCALCATEWHLVRVQCSLCGASGKSIAYQSVSAKSDDAPDLGSEAAVRAETCDACKGYRKILYEEKDMAVEPLADDLASLNLDLLLGASGYHRASSNPLLWQARNG